MSRRPRTPGGRTVAAGRYSTVHVRSTRPRITSGSSSARGRSGRRRVRRTPGRSRRTTVGASVPQELTVVDRETAVHDDGNPGGFGARARGVVGDAELQPDELGMDGDRFVHHRAGEFAAAEHVYDVDRLLAGGVGQRAIAALAENRVVAGVDRHDAIAGPLQVARDAEARSLRFGGAPHHRDGARLAQQVSHHVGRHASGRCRCGAPLTARPTRIIPARRAIVSARVDGTLGVAIHASPARAPLYASSAEMRPVTRSPRPVTGSRASTAAPIALSTALWRPMSSAWKRNPSPSVSAAAWMPPVSL